MIALYIIPDEPVGVRNISFEGTKEITIPNSVTFIDSDVLDQWDPRSTRVNTITIGENVSIGKRSVVDGTTITTLTRYDRDNSFGKYYNDNGRKTGTYVCDDSRYRVWKWHEPGYVPPPPPSTPK
jgi:hypothetical protein